jgi:hypothetical protein
MESKIDIQIIKEVQKKMVTEYKIQKELQIVMHLLQFSIFLVNKKTNNVKATCVAPKFFRISKAINKSIFALNEDIII